MQCRRRDANLLSSAHSMSFWQVDLVLTGHMHCYERTLPVINGTVYTEGVSSDGSVLTQPQAPVYIVQGTAGAAIIEKFVKPAPGSSRFMDSSRCSLVLLSLGRRTDFIIVLIHRVVAEAHSEVRLRSYERAVQHRSVRRTDSHLHLRQRRQCWRSLHDRQESLVFGRK